MLNRTALACLFSAACHPAPSPGLESSQPPISRTLLAHRDVPELPGWETRLYLIEYQGGVAAPVHHHPVEGIGYVVEGRFESAFDGEAPIVVRAGEGFRDRAIVPHVVFRNPDPGPLRFVV
jgi:quercetin dioxygenase-like cupin family protein